ncbi:GLPGLI family protein [Nonlabens xiamenensis]|uniref:GLPGLI family protein n=1 Tax=Nonlabens xiamenensis TaxID=2341043 RepID=UPI000F60B03F|nr:GLPGLI family protein [Nonlabens xiamenensis]
MKILLPLSLLCFALIQHDQPQTEIHQVEYLFYINDPDPNWGLHDSYMTKVVTDGSLSNSLSKDVDTIIPLSDGSILETMNPYFVKDYHLKSIYSSTEDEFVLNMGSISRPIYISDQVRLDFTLGTAKKTILGYTCDQYYLNYEGRQYEVYITDQLTYPIGPYKFISPIGAVLEVRSFDNAVSIVAKSHTILEQYELQSSFAEKPSMDFQSFVALYMKHYTDLKTKLESEFENSENFFTSRKIEIYPNKYDKRQ